ncbi:hypothetical protein CBS101457_001361 [Exobasidium rhododendri]|nr:hypothetical protein CBS101457_001361 [Exobasidium rhododendri]
MTSESNRPKQRMPSAVRVRRHESSRLFNFLERHAPRKSQDHGRPVDVEERKEQETVPAIGATPALAKRPGLGPVRRSSGAIEQLVMSDRRAATSAASSNEKPASSQQRMGGSRATDGALSGLSMVSEDVTPTGQPVDASADYPATIREDEEEAEEDHSIDRSTKGMLEKDYFPAKGAPAIDPLADADRSSRLRSGSNRSLSFVPSGNTVPSKQVVDGTSSSTLSNDPNQATSTSSSLYPPKEGASPSKSGLSRSERLRKKISSVSIPTPVQEEPHDEHLEDYDDVNHTDDVADYLDVIDPEVGALGYLSNIGNSIFLPHIPALYDRRPSHSLPTNRKRGASVSSVRPGSRRDSVISSRSRHSQGTDGALEEGRAPALSSGVGLGAKPTRIPSRSVMTRMSSAVGWGKKDEDEEEFTKHIKNWRDMDEEERDELDEHVKMLLTKKSKFRRGAKGFWAFVKTPMGFIMTLYGVLVTFWGTAIVLFIFGWIHVGHRKRYWIEICDQILCALFSAVGLGFAPFRAVDTYRMIHIAHYHHLTWKRRKVLGLHELNDPNDLPRPEEDGSNQVQRADEVGDDMRMEELSAPTRTGTDSKHMLLHDHSKKHKESIGHKFNKKVILPSQAQERAEAAAAAAAAKEAREAEELKHLNGDKSDGEKKREIPLAPLKRNESIQSELIKDTEDVVVLTKGEQATLEHHQRKFHASHTFYRFHETATHRAFPLDLMIVITCLLDCHSILQGALGGTTWGIKYTHRPTALTATIISCSLSCNAVAGLIIWLGGRATKKKEEVERRLKIALEQEAFAKIERRRARGELPDRGAAHGKSRSSDEEDEDRAEAATEEERSEESLEVEAAHKKRNELAADLALS